MPGNYSPKIIYPLPDLSRARDHHDLARMVGTVLKEYADRTIAEFKRISGAKGGETPIIISTGGTGGGGSSGSIVAGNTHIRWNDQILVTVVGDYTQPFDVAMPDDKYSLTIKCLRPNGNLIQHQEKGKTANNFTIYVPLQPYTLSFHAVKTI